MGEAGIDAAAYLPASLVKEIARGSVRDLPWCREIQGTAVMADLSGFTSLSERLARLGDEGAERLTEAINSFFTRMLDTAARYGGDTLTFGGDAILLMFEGPGHAGRAVAASLAMLRQTARSAAVDAGDGRVKLGMSVGASSGLFLSAAAGTIDERALLFLLGRGAEATANAEALAERGQLVVSASTLQSLDTGSVIAAAVSPGYWRIDMFPAADDFLGKGTTHRPSEAAMVTPDLRQRLAPFLPPYAAEAAPTDERRHQLEPEHRRVAVVFVNVRGLSELLDSSGTEGALAQLQTYSALVTRLATRHHGFVVSSDIATEGFKLIITFGAPVAHEYATANAARFALELDAELKRAGLALTHRIGLNGGHVFAGEVGPPFRRQYTVMGDEVNLAARLMAATTPGRILASRNLLDRAGAAFCYQEIEPIQVKGKEKPIAVCLLEPGERPPAEVPGRSGAHGTRLLGRERERRLIREAWQRTCAGRGRTVLVEGEAGIGKTRLIDETLRGEVEAGKVVRSACYEHLQAVPFSPWIPIIATALGLDPRSPAWERPAIALQRLEAMAPDLVEFGSLLSPLLGLALPESDVVMSLDGRTRRQRLLELISQVLIGTAEHAAGLIVIEDIHWADESSLALVEHLAGKIPESRLLLLLSSRPEGAHLDLPLGVLTKIAVRELTAAQSLAMLREALGAIDLPKEIGQTVYEKTRGNPLFLEEVVHSLQRPGVLDRIQAASTVALAAEMAALEIPDRVQGLLMSRIDRLPSDTRDVLKAASVVGRAFDRTTLAGIDERFSDELLGAASAELVAAALITPDQSRPSSIFTFHHALVQDVAYESLPYVRKRQLHGRVARLLEETEGSRDHGLLVHHYRRAGDQPKTHEHAVWAARSSKDLFAFREAIDYLGIATTTVGRRDPARIFARSRLDELTADCFEALGRHDRAITGFLAARRRWHAAESWDGLPGPLERVFRIDDPEARDSELCWKIAVSVERGPCDYRRVALWLDKALAALPQGHGAVRCRILITRSTLCYRTARLKEALQWAEQALGLAKADRDRGLQGYAHTAIGIMHMGLGSLHKAIRAYRQAAADYEATGDLAGQSTAHSNIASCSQLLGDLSAALHHNELALALDQRLLNPSGMAIVHNNLGEVLLLLGRAAEAEDHLQQVLAHRDDEEVSQGLVGFALVNLSKARLRQGHPELAWEPLEEGRRLLRGAGVQQVIGEADRQQAELLLAAGRIDEGTNICAAALADARAMQQRLEEVQSLRLLGRLRLAAGDRHSAEQDLRLSIRLAKSLGAEYERAMGLLALSELSDARPATGDHQTAGRSGHRSLRDEAVSALERCGVEGALIATLRSAPLEFAPVHGDINLR